MNQRDVEQIDEAVNAAAAKAGPAPNVWTGYGAFANDSQAEWTGWGWSELLDHPFDEDKTPNLKEPYCPTETTKEGQQ